MDWTILFAILLLGTNALAFFLGRKEGLSKACDNCLRQGLSAGFKAGLLQHHKVDIQIEEK